MGRKYKQSDFSDRKEIEKLNARRFIVRQIGKNLQVSPGTISHELNETVAKLFPKV